MRESDSNDSHFVSHTVVQLNIYFKVPYGIFDFFSIKIKCSELQQRPRGDMTYSRSKIYNDRCTAYT